MDSKNNGDRELRKKPRVSIPVDFETAIDGLLKVKPSRDDEKKPDKKAAKRQKPPEKQ